MRTIWNVRQLVPCQMVFSLQSSIANVTNESAFDCVLDDVLLHQFTFGESHLTLGTAVKNGAIERGLLADFSGLKCENGFTCRNCDIGRVERSFILPSVVAFAPSVASFSSVFSQHSAV